MVEYWWKKIEETRKKIDVVLTPHFFERWVEKEIFDTRDEAVEEITKAIKGIGEFFPAVDENEHPDKWDCIFKNKKSELLESPILFRPHLKKSGVFVSIPMTIYRINNFGRDKRQKALNSYLFKYKNNGQ